MTYCNVNGHLVRAEDAVISIHDRGFRYGDGVFETIAVLGGVPYQFEWHVKRLTEGLHALKIAFDTSSLHSHCRELLRKNALSGGILRIQVTRGIGSKGYLPDATHPQAGASLVIETAPLPAIPHKPVALWQSALTRISPRALPVQYKLCQGLNSTLARIEAAENHCADALLLNESGHVCETSSGNLFWFRDGRLYTPALSCGALNGSTRAAVMRLSPYPVCDTEADIKTLAQAQAVFITNAVWQVLAVAQLLPAGQRWQSQTITGQFHELITKDKEDYSHAHRDKW